MRDLSTRIMSFKGTCLFSTGQAGFIIKSASGQLLGIDLYLSNCVERVEGNKGFKRLLPQLLAPADLSFDVIVCTHPHLDHFDIDSVPEIVAGGAKLLCSVGCESLVHQLQMENYNERITYVQPGDKISCGDFDIAIVNCDHGTSAPDAVGVVIKVDNKTIYEAGDTCLRLDFSDEIPKPLDVLIAPINGMYGNMNEEDCFNYCKAINPDIMIPCHYGMFAAHGGSVGLFYSLFEKESIDTKLLLMAQGECLKL